MRKTIPILCVLLTGCATNPPCLGPEVVEITRTEYVPIPEHLLADCGVSFSTPETNGDMLEQWREARDRLEQCQRQIEALRGLR